MAKKKIKPDERKSHVRLDTAFEHVYLTPTNVVLR